jgi:hypothetical protein
MRSIARAAMRERLAVAAERYDAGDITSDLNVVASWVQQVREVFDPMPARVWLQAREEAKARAGGAFSLKDFHSKALSLGAMGLDLLHEALPRRKEVGTAAPGGMGLFEVRPGIAQPAPVRRTPAEIPAPLLPRLARVVRG